MGLGFGLGGGEGGVEGRGKGWAPHVGDGGGGGVSSCFLAFFPTSIVLFAFVC